jgi:hypothetical protein
VADSARMAFYKPMTSAGRKSGNPWGSCLALLPSFFGLSMAFLFRSNFNWPSMPGWDEYTYLGGANWIFNNHGTMNLVPIVTGGIFPTVYLFQVLVASTAAFMGIEPYLIFWGAPFLTIPIFGLLVYGVSAFFTQKKDQVVMSTLIVLGIAGGETLLGPQYFFPSTLSIILFLLILNLILKTEKEGKMETLLTLIFVSLFYAVYYYPLFITLPFLAIFFLRKRSSVWTRKYIPHLAALSLSAMIGISWLGASLLSSDAWPFEMKAEVLTGIYTPVLWLLFLSGTLITLRKSLITSSKQKSLLLLVAYTISLLIIYFLPPISSIRSEIVFRAFLAIIASFPFIWLQESISSMRKATVPANARRIDVRRASQIISYSFLILSLGFIIQPYISYSRNVPYWSNISSDEYSAARWIYQNTISDSYILTDPSTGYLLRGLTTRNCSTSLMIDGHTPSPNEQVNLSSSIMAFFREEDIFKISDYYASFPKRPDFVVVTTRTAYWVTTGIVNKTFCAPTSNKFQPFQGIEKFFSSLFDLVISWETVKIYRPTNASIENLWIDDFDSSGGNAWYLDGAYMNYSATTSSGTLALTFQAVSNSDAWTGTTRQLPNVSDARFMRVRSAIDVPCYALEVVLWRANESWIVYILEQAPEWSEQFFTLTKQEASSLTQIGVMAWTKDTESHIVKLDCIIFGRVVS